MSLHTNPNLANAATKTSGISPNVYSAIKSASQKTGVSFDYLLDQARTESNFKTDIKSKTSSATGLYQFINSTWISMVDKYGDKYGIDTKQDKQKILDMRKDPEVASFMAAEFAKENGAHLQNTVGGQIGETDLYLAHFLGAGGAETFLKEWKANPNQMAETVFPTAAKANKNVFTDPKTGQKRSLDEVYQYFAGKFDGGNTPNVVAPTTTVAHVMPADAPLAPTADQTAQDIAMAASLGVATPYKQGSIRAIAPKMELPILSPYTNMILAALEVPRGNNKGEGSVWFKGSGLGGEGEQAGSSVNSLFGGLS